jgi:hypothetical protein
LALVAVLDPTIRGAVSAATPPTAVALSPSAITRELGGAPTPGSGSSFMIVYSALNYELFLHEILRESVEKLCIQSVFFFGDED